VTKKITIFYCQLTSIWLIRHLFYAKQYSILANTFVIYKNNLQIWQVYLFCAKTLCNFGIYTCLAQNLNQFWQVLLSK
jgi:hypothetical protein